MLLLRNGGLAAELIGRVQPGSESRDDRVVGAEQAQVAVVVLLQDLHRSDAVGGGRCGSEPLDLGDCSGEAGPRGVCRRMWLAEDLDIDFEDRFQSSHLAPGLRELIGFGWTLGNSCNGTCPRGSPFSSIITLLLLLSLLLSLLCAMCGRSHSVASSRSSCRRRLAAASLGVITVRFLGSCGGIFPEETAA